MAKRTAVYVDGFNLYHSLLKGNDSVKWLDLKALSGALLNQDNEITLIRYFTARVSNTPNDPRLALRQDVYLRALQAHIPELTVQEGQFKTEKKNEARGISSAALYRDLASRGEGIRRKPGRPSGQ